MGDSDTKKWYQSKGIIGGIVTILAVALGAFGYQLAPEDQTQLIEAVSAIGGVIGGLLAIWGRMAATKNIG